MSDSSSNNLSKPYSGVDGILWAEAASPSLRYVTQEFAPSSSGPPMSHVSTDGGGGGGVEGALSPVEGGYGWGGSGGQQPPPQPGGRRGLWARLFR